MMQVCSMGTVRGLAMAGAVVLADVGAMARGVVGPVFDVGVNFNALVIRSGNGAPGYHLFPGITVSGFTDEFHPANQGTIQSNDTQFNGSIGQGSSSVSFASVADLRDALTNSTGWSIDITDGATGLQYTYTFTLDATTLVNDHMRPMQFTNVSQGGTISTSPTFTWSFFPEENPGDPLTAFDLAVGQLSGPVSTFVGLPVPSTAWTPAGPIPTGLYEVVVQFQGTGDAAFMVPSTPMPAGAEPLLNNFTWFSNFGTYVSVSNLNAVPPPPACPGDLNNDGQRDTVDLVRFLGQFSLSCPQVTGVCADFNNDNVVNTSDLVFFLARFGVPCP